MNLVRAILLSGAACLSLAACETTVATPSMNAAATADFTAEQVLTMAQCSGFLSATGEPEAGEALAYRARQLGPSRRLSPADLDAEAESGNALKSIAGSPSGNQLRASCTGLYRAT